MTPEEKIVVAQGSMSPALSCAECEEHLADFLDGVAHRKSAIEAHLATCAECADLARDAHAAMAFAGRVADVDLPATLIPQILAEITTGPSRVLVQASLAERIFGRWIRPMLQPRFALGVAMAALSIALIPRDAIPTSSGRIWTLAENRVYRTFDRAVKNYENLALVANVQIDEWAGDPSSDEKWTNDDLTNGDTRPDANAGGRSR